MITINTSAGIPVYKKQEIAEKEVLQLPEQAPDEFVKSTKQEDTQETSETKKTAIICTTSLAALCAAFVSIIGRNPAKAARVLTGTAEHMSPIFKQGNEILERIIPKSKNIISESPEIAAVFAKKGEQSSVSNVLTAIDEITELATKENVTLPPKVTEALTRLRNKTTEFNSTIEATLNKGESLILSEEAEKFYAANRDEIIEISKILSDSKLADTTSNLSQKLSKFSTLQYSYSSREFIPTLKITECPKGVLPENGIFYHGTAKTKGIYENGLSPYSSRQLTDLGVGRELGAGVYVTPNKEVAASFMNIKGKIIPVRLAPDARVAQVNEESYQQLQRAAVTYIQKNYPSLFAKGDEKQLVAAYELFIQRIFKDAGYDAAYIPKGVKPRKLIDISANINEVLGLNQSQLVAFSPEKLKITDSTIKERLLDFFTFCKQDFAKTKWHIQHPFGV